jgi:hypothetical protein
MLFYSKYKARVVTVPGKPEVKFVANRFSTDDAELIAFLSKCRGVYPGEKAKPSEVPADEHSTTPGPARSWSRTKKAKE